MKSIFIVLSICLSFIFALNAQSSNVIIHNYKIDALLKESEQRINVDLICTLAATEDLNSLQFLLNSETDLLSVSCRSNSEWQKISFSFNGKDSLLLTSDKKFLKDDYTEIKFNYSLPVDALNDTILLLDRGHRWYPLIVDQIFTYTLKCTVPEKYEVLTSGNLQTVKNINKNSVFNWNCNKPVFKLPLIIFNPEVYKRSGLISSENILDFYPLTIDSVNTENILHQADVILSYFSKTIGRYGRDKLTYFEVSSFPGINVGSGLLTTGTQSLEMINKGSKDFLILTIAQQWFGAGVFPDFNKKGFFFFSISLPHYLRLMYLRDSEGEEAFNNLLLTPMKRYEEFAGSGSDIPLIDVDIPNTKEKSIILYAKGPFILNKIEGEMGRDNWKSFLADLYLAFFGKIMTYEDFKNYMKKYDETGKVLILFEKLMSEKGMSERL
ncbi:MAG: hypothetical protein KGZ85_12635 [Ignavibacterium sp.]|nr:hypothetical protein [Ignavibacterium sp.]